MIRVRAITPVGEFYSKWVDVTKEEVEKLITEYDIVKFNLPDEEVEFNGEFVKGNIRCVIPEGVKKDSVFFIEEKE